MPAWSKRRSTLVFDTTQCLNPAFVLFLNPASTGLEDNFKGRSHPMSLFKLSTMALLAALAAAGGIASAQTQDPHHPETDNGAGQGEAIQPGGPGTMPRGMMPGMMGRDMMPSGTMGGMPMGPMRGHMMKIMFAIADADGDGALSFEEVTAIHKRVFDKVDANKDGKVTPEEMQAFMRQ
jgi:hypothetical protein